MKSSAAEMIRRASGSMPRFPEGCTDWRSERMKWFMRPVLWAVDMMYLERGAPHPQVVRMLGKEPPYCWGIAADVSLAGLPGVTALDPTREPPPVVRDLCARLNAMTPRSDGLETFSADGATLKIRLPINGPPIEGNWFADWDTLGATGVERNVQRNPNDLQGSSLKRDRKDFWR